MLIRKSYGLAEFLYWTRRKTFLPAAVVVLATAAYQLAGHRWIAIPWPVLAMLGTAASFIVGFKNLQTYQRTVEAQQIWSSITSASRHWALISRDFPGNAETTRALIHTHLAWLTAVRYQLRSPRPWAWSRNSPSWMRRDSGMV